MREVMAALTPRRRVILATNASSASAGRASPTISTPTVTAPMPSQAAAVGEVAVVEHGDGGEQGLHPGRGAAPAARQCLAQRGFGGLEQGGKAQGRFCRGAAQLVALRRPPALRFAGAVDHTIRGALADDVVGVARELLSNSVRHAGADTISLDVGITGDDVSVVVADDGAGIRDERRSGLANLAERASARGGSLTMKTGADGTRAEWRVPIEGTEERRTLR